MRILVAEDMGQARPLHDFFEKTSAKLLARIHGKLQRHAVQGVYPCRQLKVLNPRIWKYRGTIYKLRVDNGRESARVLFARTSEGDLLVLHAFLKTTRKTPARDARQAIALYRRMDSLETREWASAAAIIRDRPD